MVAAVIISKAIPWIFKCGLILFHVFNQLAVESTESGKETAAAAKL